MVPKHYYCELYRMNYYFCIGWKEDAINSYLKKNFDYTPVKIGVGRCFQVKTDKGDIIIVWTSPKAKLWDLAHECVHAVSYTFEKIGVVPDWVNDEPQAYLVGHLMKKAMELRNGK